MALIDKLTAIANAIRGKTGGTEALTLDQMATEIAGIETGGGGEDTLTAKFMNTLTEYSNSEMTSVPQYAFAGCTSLESVDFPAATNIGERAFQGCSKITEMSFPDVAEMGLHAFNGCTSLTNVYAPELVTLTPGANNGNQFDGCSKLAEIYAPKLKTTAYRAFYNCKALVDVDFPELTTVANHAFSNCGIRIANFPKVTTISDTAFNGCTSLTHAIFPMFNGSPIQSRTFNSDTALQYAIFGGVTTIANNAFTACTSCKLVILDKTAVATASAASSISPLMAIYVPSALLSDYKAATNFATYADKIFAIEDSEEILGVLAKYGVEYGVSA